MTARVIQQRETWYGRDARPTEGIPVSVQGGSCEDDYNVSNPDSLINRQCRRKEGA